MDVRTPGAAELLEGLSPQQRAAVLHHGAEFRGRRVVAVISGGNLDLNAFDLC